jgi:hypothetical protein
VHVHKQAHDMGQAAALRELLQGPWGAALLVAAMSLVVAVKMLWRYFFRTIGACARAGGAAVG